MRSRAAPTRNSNPAQLSRLADMAAEKAVQRTFTALGVDISTPEAIIKQQQIFSGMRTLQEDLRAFKTKFWSTVGGLAASGVVAAIWHYVQAPRPPL